MTFKRADRVSEAIKREVSVLILQDLRDPEIANITVMDVETSDDLRQARIFVSIMGDDDQKKRSMEGLDRAKGFIRSRISKCLQLRYSPEIFFKMDATLDKAMRIEEVLNKIKAQEGKTPPPDKEAQP